MRRDLRARIAAALGGLILILAGGFAVSLERELGSPDGPAKPVIRTGTVLADPAPTGDLIWVRMTEDGEALDLPYVAEYTPVPGDQVQVLYLATSGAMQGVVIGGRSGQSGNLVLNGDFGRLPQLQSSLPPHLWGHYRAAGSNGLVLAELSADDLRPVMTIFANDNPGDNYAYSAAIRMAPGEVLRADGVYRMDVVGTITVTVDLIIGWFGSTIDTWPTAVSTSVLMTAVHTVDGPRLLSGQATAPDGTVAARVGFRVRNTGASAQYTMRVGNVYATR